MNDSSSLAQGIILHQQQSKWAKFVFDEIGANSEVAHTLQQYPWSSSVVQKSLVSYNQDEQFRNITNVRSVSKEFIHQALLHYQQIYQDHHIFTNSFQVEENPNKVTHWYIGVTQDNIFTIFHVTIPQVYERTEYQHKIGNIWLQIIHHLQTNEPIETPYIDQVYRAQETIEQDIAETINLMQQDSMVCIDKNWSLCRIEDLTRSATWYQPLIVFKWSFNPPHKWHLYQIEKLQEKYPQHKALFSLSVNTYDKWTINTDDIIKRIELITALWYPVVLFGSWYFKDNYALLRQKNSQEIIFPMESDTIQRIRDDQTTDLNTFDNVKFEVFWRKDQEFTLSHPLINLQEANPYDTLSSTQIRDNPQQYWDSLPAEIKNKVIDNVYT